MHRNAKSVPWASEEALALTKDRTRQAMARARGHQNPPLLPGSWVLRGYCGAKGSGNLGPFHIKPKAHAEEEEMSEDKQIRSELPGDVAEDNFVFGKSKSRNEKAARHQG